MYSSINAIATAGKTRPVKGTRIEGKNEADISKSYLMKLQFKTSLQQMLPGLLISSIFVTQFKIVS
jgi:hypothetical protein